MGDGGEQLNRKGAAYHDMQGYKLTDSSSLVKGKESIYLLLHFRC